MFTRSGQRTRRDSAKSALWLLCGILVASFATAALADDHPTTQPAPTNSAKAPVSPTSPPVNPAVRRPPTTQPARPVVQPRAPKSEYEPDANTKLVCESKEVVLDPVWRSNKALTFEFTIGNEGTADLKIKAKGG